MNPGVGGIAVRSPSSVLPLKPSKDPLRDHPRFQALLEEYEDE